MRGEAIENRGIRNGDLAKTVFRRASVVLLTLFIASALILASRCAAGALVAPLAPAGFVTTVACAFAAAVAIRWAWFHGSPIAIAGSVDLAIMGLTTLSVVATVGAVGATDRTFSLALIYLQLFLAAEEVVAWSWFLRRSALHAALPATCFAEDGDSPGADASDAPHDSSHASDGDLDGKLSDKFNGEADEETFFSDDMLQQITRRREPDGAESLRGLLRTAIAPGQRTAVVHVAFCPPLPVAPDVDVEQVSGPESRIKTAQRLPHGARFDLKLAAPAEAADQIVLRFSARANPA